MAAAALGNTFSDVIGIGSSYYVERAAALLGMSAPALSPVQLDMPVTRRFANMVNTFALCLLLTSCKHWKPKQKCPGVKYVFANY